MRLIGLLCWYDEPLSMLAATIIGLHKAHADHVIAVDGAYLLYPHAKPHSDQGQAATIRATCNELGMGCTIHTPQTPWVGNEVEKRTRMFAIAHSISDPGDWWISTDADTVVTRAPHDLKQQLEATEHDAAYCTLTEPPDPDNPQARAFEWETGSYLIRLLFRAQPMHCHIKHCAYRTPDGRYLWEPQNTALEEPAISIPELVVEHRPHQRPMLRTTHRETYYQRRNNTGAEQEATHVG